MGVKPAASLREGHQLTAMWPIVSYGLNMLLTYLLHDSIQVPMHCRVLREVSRAANDYAVIDLLMDLQP